MIRVPPLDRRLAEYGLYCMAQKGWSWCAELSAMQLLVMNLTGPLYKGYGKSYGVQARVMTGSVNVI
jgi:hypothetical protein